MVEQEDLPYCRACQECHEESTCAKFRHFNEEDINQYEGNNYCGLYDSINVVRKNFPISKEQMKQVMEGSIPTDKATKIFGEKPSRD